MEKLHRASDNAAVTLSGQRGIILRSSAKIHHKVVGEDGQTQTILVDSFSYHPSVSAEQVTLVWNNPKNIVVIDRAIADFLLLRKWAKEVPDEALEWWNGKVDGSEEPAKEPKASEPPPPPAEPPVPTPAPAAQPKAEPVKEPEKVVEKPKEQEKAPEPKEAPKPAAVKPAATKEEALKRAEEEAAKLAGEGAKKPVTD
jgi:outer membrane biosynthesis protein TonB